MWRSGLLGITSSLEYRKRSESKCPIMHNPGATLQHSMHDRTHSVQILRAASVTEGGYTLTDFIQS